MATKTKLALHQDNMQLALENQGLRKQLSEQSMQIASLRAKNMELADVNRDISALMTNVKTEVNEDRAALQRRAKELNAQGLYVVVRGNTLRTLGPRRPA